jgi:2-methylisocitrate lyase-like PEP mutase family enzyme
MTESKRSRLAAKVRNKEFFIAPGVYDMVSARIADRVGFDALYMSGYCTVASYLGLADAGLASYRDMVLRAGQIAADTTTPLIADADTGYGGLLNVRQTIQGYETAGVAGLHIEDQVDPKKCGHTPGKEVVDTEDMVRKIRVAVDARTDPDFLIIARTDSRQQHGLDEACRRAEAFANAGADMLFVEALDGEKEMEIVGKRFDVPLLINITERGMTPSLPPERLKEMGYTLAIYPGTAFAAVAVTMQTVYDTLKRDGSALALEVPVLDEDSMHDLVGFPDVWEFEKKWAPSRNAKQAK